MVQLFQSFVLWLVIFMYIDNNIYTKGVNDAALPLVQQGSYTTYIPLTQPFKLVHNSGKRRHYKGKKVDVVVQNQGKIWKKVVSEYILQSTY